MLRRTPPARVFRYPNGRWVAIGSVPIGTSIIAVQEIIDERPFREQALARILPTVGRQLQGERARLGCIGAEPGSNPEGEAAYAEVFARAIQLVRKTADIMINHDVRTALLAKLGATLNHVADAAEAMYRSGVATSSVPKSLTDFIARMKEGDPQAVNAVVTAAQATAAGDRGARDFMVKLVHQSAWTDAGRVLYGILMQANLPQIASIVQRQEASHRARLMTNGAAQLQR
jgi:hypothetical protein